MFTSKHNKRRQQVEASNVLHGTSVTVIVGLDGYDYKHYKRDAKWTNTRGTNVHISMNGPLQLTFSEARQFITDLDDTIRQAIGELEQV